jgi:hypothetical protein
MAYKGDTPIVDMVFNASADMVDYNLSIIFKSEDSSRNYLRIQTDALKGRSASLDDSSPKNLARLVKTAKDLLDEPVATRNFDTGALVPVPNGETNREALFRFADWLSEERKARQHHTSAPSPPKPEPKPEPEPNPGLPPKPDPEIGRKADVLTQAAEGETVTTGNLEKSKEANGEVQNIEHHESPFIACPYIPSLSFFQNPFELTQDYGLSYPQPQSYVSFAEPTYTSHHYNMHPIETDASPHARHYCESSYQLLPLKPQFHSYGHYYYPCQQSSSMEEYEVYPQFQWHPQSKESSTSTEFYDFFRLFS